ncbi:MAG: polymer-forming cytoskeletal protein [Coriobacteriia bacterium]|nr:polymer-forming cytoskeletal protein [Coriobacteriia bacterium]MBN2821712.1 polymer-forming cytoskeletal protein [Coriobacteriia bacterium]
MSENSARDAKIAGEGTIGGGEFGDVVINGAGKVTSDIRCVNLKINGAGSVEGNVVAQDMAVNGSGSFSGSVETAKMSVAGDATVQLGLGVGELRIMGRLTAGGVAAREIDVRGELRSGMDLQAESLVGEGAFRVAGLVDVANLDLKLHGSATAREIRGKRVSITLGRSLVGASLLALFGEKQLAVESVEADEVTLENTTAKLVRGGAVSIGSGCKIELVEYTGILNRMPDAQIGEARQVSGS